MNTIIFNRLTSVLGATLLISLLAGCGTTSGLRRPGGASQTALTQYDRVLVKDFGDKVSQKEVPEYQDQTREAMQVVTRTFADVIADEIRKTGAFQEVTREGAAGPSTIVVDGDITRFEKGRTGLRLFVGHGAGSSHFDALVELRDADSNTLLGTVVVDKNSWPMPGAVAARQTADAFMEGAAKKIASELQRAKLTPTGRP